MKILQIAHSLPFFNQAGTEIYTYNLSLELAKKHEVYIFFRICDTRQNEYEVTHKILDGISLYLINNTFNQCDSFEKYYENSEIDKRFADLLDIINPDIIHIQHLIFLSIGLIREAHKKGIPIVLTLSDYWLICPKWHFLKKDYTPCNKEDIERFNEECIDCLEDLLCITKGAKKSYSFCKQLFPGFIIKAFKNIYIFFMKITFNNFHYAIKLKEREDKIRDVLGKVDLFLAPSEYIRKVFVKFGIPGHKIKLFSYGLPDRLFPDLQKTKSENIRFAFIGTIVPAKGLHVLIGAFNAIRNENAELKIYGKLYAYTGFESYLPFLRKIAKNENIKFMDEFINEDIVHIFRDIDVLIVPSIWHENSPLVIQEAFLSKTPVIASRIGGIPEIISEGINGILFNPGDIRDLQEKMECIIANPNMIKIFKEKMPKIKSIEENAREIENIYAALLNKC